MHICKSLEYLLIQKYTKSYRKVKIRFEKLPETYIFSSIYFKIMLYCDVILTICKINL